MKSRTQNLKEQSQFSSTISRNLKKTKRERKTVMGDKEDMDIRLMKIIKTTQD